MVQLLLVLKVINKITVIQYYNSYYMYFYVMMFVVLHSSSEVEVQHGLHINTCNKFLNMVNCCC
jgi:hypothetical protein